MENFLEGGIAQLESAKAAVIDLGQKEQACKELDRTLKARQKEFEIQQKRIEEKITSTIKKSRASLDKEYDGQISAAEKAIKEAENSKKAAKAAAVSQRMKYENSSLVDENRVMQAEIHAHFKETGVPSICKNTVYYSLFMPSGKKDYIVCAIAAIICAVIIPFLITRFVSTTFLAVLVWILIIVFFAALYFVVASWSKKGARLEELIRARSRVEQIAANKKSIQRRNKNIKADPDESQYNLYEYDNQIAMAKTDYEEINKQKDAAVKNFEEVESVEIRTRMEAEYAGTLEDIQRVINLTGEELKVKNESRQEAAGVVDEYKAYLGDKNIKPEKIDELTAIISEGRATTINEAVEVQKTK